jgi:hypothetical protein
MFNKDFEATDSCSAKILKQQIHVQQKILKRPIKVQQDILKQ